MAKAKRSAGQFGMIKYPKKSYVYAHYLEDDINPYYVGKGTNARAFMNYSRPDGWVEPDYVRILEDGLSSSEARELEALVMHTYGLENLLNKQSGGVTEEGKKKLSEKRMGVEPWNKDKKVSEEYKESYKKGWETRKKNQISK